jgi:hypothetical protein
VGGANDVWQGMSFEKWGDLSVEVAFSVKNKRGLGRRDRASFGLWQLDIAAVEIAVEADEMRFDLAGLLTEGRVGADVAGGRPGCGSCVFPSENQRESATHSILNVCATRAVLSSS